MRLELQLISADKARGVMPHAILIESLMIHDQIFKQVKQFEFCFRRRS